MATEKQQKAIKNVVENRGNVSKAMRDAGYEHKTAKNPKNLTESVAWKEMMEKAFSDTDLAQKHKELLDATSLDHMTFPLGPKETESEEELDEDGNEKMDYNEYTNLLDSDIHELLKSVNCTVRRIVHGKSARHVYFWAYDNKARKEALDMAYKLKGKYAAEKSDIRVEQAITATPEAIALAKEYEERIKKGL